MFEDVLVEELIPTLGGHDFGASANGDLPHRMGAEHVDAIVAFERIIRHAQAGLAEHTAALDSRQRDVSSTQPAAGGIWVDDAQVAKSVIGQVAMARQMSATGAETQYIFALALARMPQVARQLRSGRIGQRVAKAVTDECAFVSHEIGRRVDRELGPDLHLLTAKRAAQVARRLVIAADPHAAHERATGARADRHVSATAAPDAMGKLNLFGTAAQVWACFGASIPMPEG